MRWSWLPALLFLPALSAQEAPASVPTPTLPDGAQSRWVVTQPEEILTYLAFDPVPVRARLPANLRFVTVGELAEGRVGWARELLEKDPAKASWGVSFLEIVRMGTFSIDGRSPAWPKHGAVGLWFARVAPSDPATDLGPGRPLLVLDFWLPDRPYVGFLQDKGYPASYGDVALRRDSSGRWSGSVKVAGLRVEAQCRPEGPVTGGPGSAGTQALFPPQGSPRAKLVRVAFAGHREQGCGEGSPWRLKGTHPLAGATLLGAPSFEYGYDLIGGTYERGRLAPPPSLR